jgi:hypothetical protein
MKRFHTYVAAGAAALCVTYGVAWAQTEQVAQTQEAVEAPDPALMGFSPTFVRAYDVAMARIASEISHEHQIVLNLAAYAAAAAAICPDLGLNESGLYGLLTESSHSELDEGSSLTPEQHRDFSMIAFGVVTGLMLEEAAADEAAFCTDAVEYSNETGQALLRQISQAVPYNAGN